MPCKVGVNGGNTFVGNRPPVPVLCGAFEGSPSMGYDPLMADPDYVVVGRFGRWLGVYAPLVEAGQVRLIKQIGRYDVY